MKIKNQVGFSGDADELVPKGHVIIPRENAEGNCIVLRLLVSGMPFDWTERSSSLLQEPTAPRDFVKKNGRILRDPKDNSPITEIQYEDKRYQEQMQKYQLRLNVWLMYEALRNEPNVVFDNKKPGDLTKESVTSWLDNLREEVNASGLTTGDVSLIIERTRELTNLSIGYVEKARASFLKQEEQQKEETQGLTEEGQ